MGKRRLERLQRVTVFRGVRASVLAPFVNDFVVRAFAPGQRIWHEGEAATHFSFLSAGHVKLARYSSEGDETILGLFHPGDTLGHVTTHRSIPYPATAIAIAPAEVLEVPKARLFALLEGEPRLMRALVDDTTRWAHTLLARIQDLTSGHAEERLAGVFVRLAEGPTGLRDADTSALSIPLALTRRDLAGLVCIREETAIRIMSRWQSSGLVETHPQGFVVRDLARLRALAAQPTA